jgi:3-oxoacyl-[acyl-carrier protein] reductase
MTLEGRAAIVTGAAQGIGAGIARALVEEGALVVLADIDVSGAEATASALDPSGERAWPLSVDVRTKISVEEVVGKVTQRWRRLDVMVNNAGINICRSFLDLTEDEWDDVLAVNLRGVLFGCQVAAEAMRPAGYGRIINLASDAGQQPSRFVAGHYAASKAGVVALTKVAALALARDGITVNAIAPAAIHTPVMDALPAEQVQALEAAIPIGRVGTPDEIGAVAVLLASDKASYITGATYDINGGLVLR